MNAHRETVTSSIETDTSPELVIQVLSDPRRIPQWAPGFADRVEAGENGCWEVTKGDRTFAVEVVTFGPARTVDYVRDVTPGRKGGAFLRVLQRPRGGSVIVMTLPSPPGTSAEETATILDQELLLLTNLCASL
jgi:Polyketide cyclase / dehydrase and lipid transport